MSTVSEKNMMREQVTIVLNEREPLKARAAEALQSALSDLGVTASRVPVTEEIEQVVVKRQPLIVVLDYLLGDFSTGLDILSRIESLDSDERPRVFFLTDEPSVPVAVQAMQHGALDYMEVDHPQSIQKLARAVQKEILSIMTLQANAKSCPISTEPTRIDDLIAEAPSTAAARSQLETLAQAPTHILILDGPNGCGKKSWARAYANLRQGEATPRLCDLRLSTESAEAIIGHAQNRVGPKLGVDLNLTILHAEEDDGALLEQISSRTDNMWSAKSDSFLVICTADASVAEAWARAIPSARRISIPALSQRNEDIAPLMQRFCNDAAALSSEKLKAFDAAALRWAGTMEWPGNVRQLRAVTIEAALRAARTKDKTLAQLLEQQLEQWNNEFLSKGDATERTQEGGTALTLAHALELCGHQYRAAAALMGLPTRKFLARLTDGHAAEAVATKGQARRT